MLPYIFVLSLGAFASEPPAPDLSVRSIVDRYRDQGSYKCDVEDALCALGVRRGRLMSWTGYARIRRSDLCLAALTLGGLIGSYASLKEIGFGTPWDRVTGTVEPITARILRDAIENDRNVQDAMVEEAKREVDGPAFETYRPAPGEIATVLPFESALYGAEALRPVGDRVTLQMRRVAQMVNQEFMKAGRFDPALGAAPVYFLVGLASQSGRGHSTVRFALFSRGGPIHRIDFETWEDDVDRVVAKRILKLIRPPKRPRV